MGEGSTQYKVRGPDGHWAIVIGPKPPTKEQLDKIFASLPGPDKPEVAQPTYPFDYSPRRTEDIQLPSEADEITQRMLSTPAPRRRPRREERPLQGSGELVSPTKPSRMTGVDLPGLGDPAGLISNQVRRIFEWATGITDTGGWSPEHFKLALETMTPEQRAGVFANIASVIPETGLAKGLGFLAGVRGVNFAGSRMAPFADEMVDAATAAARQVGMGAEEAGEGAPLRLTLEDEVPPPATPGEAPSPAPTAPVEAPQLPQEATRASLWQRVTGRGGTPPTEAPAAPGGQVELTPDLERAVKYQGMDRAKAEAMMRKQYPERFPTEAPSGKAKPPQTKAEQLLSRTKTISALRQQMTNGDISREEFIEAVAEQWPEEAARIAAQPARRPAPQRPAATPATPGEAPAGATAAPEAVATDVPMSSDQLMEMEAFVSKLEKQVKAGTSPERAREIFRLKAEEMGWPLPPEPTGPPPVREAPPPAEVESRPLARSPSDYRAGGPLAPTPAPVAPTPPPAAPLQAAPAPTVAAPAPGGPQLVRGIRAETPTPAVPSRQDAINEAYAAHSARIREMKAAGASKDEIKQAWLEYQQQAETLLRGPSAAPVVPTPAPTPEPTLISGVTAAPEVPVTSLKVGGRQVEADPEVMAAIQTAVREKRISPSQGAASIRQLRSGVDPAEVLRGIPTEQGVGLTDVAGTRTSTRIESVVEDAAQVGGTTKQQAIRAAQLAYGEKIKELKRVGASKDSLRAEGGKLRLKIKQILYPEDYPELARAPVPPAPEPSIVLTPGQEEMVQAGVLTREQAEELVRTVGPKREIPLGAAPEAQRITDLPVSEQNRIYAERAERAAEEATDLSPFLREEVRTGRLTVDRAREVQATARKHPLKVAPEATGGVPGGEPAPTLPSPLPEAPTPAGGPPEPSLEAGMGILDEPESVGVMADPLAEANRAFSLEEGKLWDDYGKRLITEEQLHAGRARLVEARKALGPANPPREPAPELYTSKEESAWGRLSTEEKEAVEAEWQDLSERVMNGEMTPEQALAEMGSHPALADVQPTRRFGFEGSEAQRVSPLQDLERPISGRGRGGDEEGFMQIQNVLGLAGGLTGAAGGAATGYGIGETEEEKVRNAIIWGLGGGIAGAGLGYAGGNEARIWGEGGKSFLGRTANMFDQYQQAAMMTGPAQWKSLFGGLSSAPIRMVENFPLHPWQTLRQAGEAVTAIPQGIRDAAHVAWTGENPLFSASLNRKPAEGIASLPFRAVGVPDAFFRRINFNMTPTSDEAAKLASQGVLLPDDQRAALAARWLQAGEPQTKTGRFFGNLFRGAIPEPPPNASDMLKETVETANKVGPIARGVTIPIGYTAGTNLLEQGLQRTPGINFLLQGKNNPLRVRPAQSLVNFGLGTGAVGAGALADMFLPEGYQSRAAAAAATGPYALPFGIGVGLSQYANSDDQDLMGLPKNILTSLARGTPLSGAEIDPVKFLTDVQGRLKPPVWDLLFAPK